MEAEEGGDEGGDEQAEGGEDGGGGGAWVVGYRVLTFVIITAEASSGSQTVNTFYHHRNQVTKCSSKK